MDNETLETTAERPRLPSAAMPASAARTIDDSAGRDASERNGIFRSLVSDDSDIAGLVAYSIYKQNKLDWLRAFEVANGRAPDTAEISAYIIGEGTPRRLATYRHLAEATLNGRGPEIDAPQGPRPSIARRTPGIGDARTIPPALIATYALIAILFFIGLWLALHFTVTTR